MSSRHTNPGQDPGDLPSIETESVAAAEKEHEIPSVSPDLLNAWLIGINMETAFAIREANKVMALVKMGAHPQLAAA